MNAALRRLPREDRQPWFRQFWPWFLIALPGSVVIAAFVTLFIAIRHADDLVADEYYKEGLAINRQLEKQASAEALGYGAEVALLDGRVQVETRGLAPQANLRLTLSHPLEADRDQVLQLRRTGDARFEAPLGPAQGADWHWTLDAGEDSPWRLDGRLDTRAARP